MSREVGVAVYSTWKILPLAKKGLMRVRQSLESVHAALEAVLDALVVAVLAD